MNRATLISTLFGSEKSFSSVSESESSSSASEPCFCQPCSVNYWIRFVDTITISGTMNGYIPGSCNLEDLRTFYDFLILWNTSTCTYSLEVLSATGPSTYAVSDIPAMSDGCFPVGVYSLPLTSGPGDPDMFNPQPITIS